MVVLESARAARVCVLCSGECALQGWAPVCKQAKCVLYARAPTHPASEKHSDAKNEGAANGSGLITLYLMLRACSKEAQPQRRGILPVDPVQEASKKQN